MGLKGGLCPRGGGRRPPTFAPYLVRPLSSLRFPAFVCNATMYECERNFFGEGQSRAGCPAPPQQLHKISMEAVSSAS